MCWRRNPIWWQSCPVNDAEEVYSLGLTESKMLHTVRRDGWFCVVFCESETEAVLQASQEHGGLPTQYTAHPSTICEVNTLLQMGGIILMTP